MPLLTSSHYISEIRQWITRNNPVYVCNTTSVCGFTWVHSSGRSARYEIPCLLCLQMWGTLETQWWDYHCHLALLQDKKQNNKKLQMGKANHTMRKSLAGFAGSVWQVFELTNLNQKCSSSKKSLTFKKLMLLLEKIKSLVCYADCPSRTLLRSNQWQQHRKGI